MLLCGLMTRKQKLSLDETVAELSRKSEQKISSILASITDCHFELDKDWRFIRINDHSLAYFGRQREELIGRSYFEVFPTLKRSIFEEHYTKAVSESTSVHFDVESVLYPGKWVELHVYPTEGRGVSVFFRDITERKLADEETKRLATVIQEERDRLSALVNSIQDEVWFADAEGRFTLANPSALREFSLGVSTKEIDVEKLAQSLEVYRADGSPRPIEETPPLRALQGEVVRNQEEMIRTPAGAELRYRAVSAAPVRDAANTIIGSVSVVRDITDLKRAEIALRESEERFRAFMDNSPAIAWAKDEQGRIIYLNRAYEQRFGVRLEDWRGKTDFELWPPEIARTFRRNDLDVLAAGRTQEMVEEATDPEGNHSFWWNFKFPFQDASGHHYVGGIGIDITDRKRIEKQLKDYQEHLEKLVEERTKELRMKSLNLEEVNTALRVLLEQREQDKNELEDKILFNVKKLILPHLDSLKQRHLDDEQRTYLDVLETNLKNIISPFAKKLTSIHENFTPQEIKVADFIRDGKTVKEIAVAFGVSESAINLHRQHIRNKLGLNNQKVNLRTYLMSLT